MPLPRRRVGLFVTCLVDLFRPTVGFSAMDLLEGAGCDVTVPETQTCCGQPAYNSGDAPDARAIARSVIEVFENFEYVVAPSGSCAGMIRCHYPALFGDEPEWADRAARLAEKTHELLSFLSDICHIDPPDTYFRRKVTYHDSCSGLRELGIKKQPRSLLSRVKGLELKEMSDAEICCGFGGTFCVKYPDISNRMVGERVEAIEASGAETLLGGDMGCLMNMAGKLKRMGSKIEVRHVAEVLANQTDVPPIAGRE